MTGRTPRELGFSFPAEWSPHAATWTSWPFGEQLWGEDLSQVRNEFTEFVKTIARFEPVHLLVTDSEAEFSARQHLSNVSHVFFHLVPLDDIWLRDNGPIFIRHKTNGTLAFTKWEFNAWGKKFAWQKDNLAANAVTKFLAMEGFQTGIVMEGGSLETNGLGLALTTRQCLLNQNRNPNLNQTDLERALKEFLGLSEMIWLECGLEGDHTDGHIDTIVRFVDENTIVCSVTHDKDDCNFIPMRENFATLKNFIEKKGNEKLRIAPLVLPKHRIEHDGLRLPATYANFYIGNGFVIVPQYGDPHDHLALDTLRPFFVGREVIGLTSKALIRGGGSFHCVTQQQPAGALWKSEKEL